jgi:hypothetical protein
MITPEVMEKMHHVRLGKRTGWILICILLILAGAAAFLFGISGSHPERAWQAYLVNFMFWIGVASGAVMFSAVLTITDARWGRPLKRLAESMGTFLPVACLLFWALYFGREHIFHWIHDPLPEKAAWLNVPFLFLRDGVGMILLTVVGLWLVYHSVRMDRKSGSGAHEAGALEDASTRAQKRLSPIYGVLYAFILTLLAFDLIMSLEPHWYSTLFGVWYFMGSFYTGLAALIILLAIGVRSMGMGLFVKGRQYLGLGQLLLGFCLITGDFFFTQLLIMWYGNLPEESGYVLTRMRQSPWPPLALIALLTCYAIPFGVLLSRRIKMKTIPMVLLAVVILTGIWLERLMLVAPALWKGKTLPLGIPEVLITAGFAGMLFLCVLLFLSRYPVLPLGDPMFLEVVAQFEKETKRAEGGS